MKPMKYLLSKSLFLIAAIALMSATLIKSDVVPNKTVKKLDGSSTSILNVLSQADWTVMTFWATWCIPCKKELENIRDLYDDWQSDYGAQVVAISVDDAKTVAGVRPYVTANDFGYVFLLDQNRSLFTALNGVAPPLTLITNNKGEIKMVKNKYVEGDEYIIDDKLADYSGG